jgi:CRP/FNR family cyclic AMP-dependent transcriptional regulator
LNGPTFTDFNNRQPEPIRAKVSQETLAEMIGETRPRVSFMNRFRKLGLIDYNGGIESTVHF